MSVPRQTGAALESSSPAPIGRGRRRRGVTALCGALLGILPAVAGAQEDVWAPACTAIDAFVARSMERDGTPGMQVAVTDGERVRCANAYGFADLKLRLPVTATTLFQIGSISKSFTALALLQLWDEGRFDPQQPVAAYLPWFEVQTAFEPITAHHLLTHTAGIPANRDEMPGTPYMAFALRQQATAWPPGSRFYYSNVGFQVLSQLLERLAGRPYGEVIQVRLLDPLGMRNSRPVITLESRPLQAVGYIDPFDDRPHHRSRPLVEAPHFGYEVGDGAVQSTGTDLAVYLRMLLAAGRGAAGRLVSEEAFARFSSPHAVDGERAYGYGIGVVERDGQRILQHSGGMVGHYARIVADRSQGLGAASLANGPADQASILEYALAVARAARDGDALPAPPEPAETVSAHPLSDYAGTYLSAAAGPWRIRLEGEALAIDDGVATAVLEVSGDDLFYTPAERFDRYRLSFTRDESGAVVGALHGPTRFLKDVSERPAPQEVKAAWRPFCGRYRSYSPWFPTFEVYEQAGHLLLLTGEGGETSSGESELFPVSPGRFRVGEAPSPEVLSFEDVVDGRALRALFSGHPFFRSPR